MTASPAYGRVVPNLITANPKILISRFLQECSRAGVTDVETIARIAVQTIAHLHGTDSSRRETETAQELQKRWYASLSSGRPDWSVYATDYYLAEMWACWTVYSRKYLAGLISPKSLPPNGILADLGQVRRVVDVGCGIAFTTAALKQIFPMAEVIGTNLSGTAQMTIAESLGRQFGFSLVNTVDQISAPTDLVLASEYFEHIPAPVEHLREMVAALKPRAFLIANAFGTRAIGHFEVYSVNGQNVPAFREIGRIFNGTLRELGYQKVNTKLWNQRPTYWKLRG